MSRPQRSFALFALSAFVACNTTQSGERTDEPMGAGGLNAGDGGQSTTSDGGQRASESGGMGGNEGVGGEQAGGASSGGESAGGTDGAGGSDGAGGTDGAGGSDGAGGMGGMTSDNLPYGHPDPEVDYPTYDGFTLYLVEEFDDPLDLDVDPVWTYSDGAFAEGDVRFVKEAIQFSDGKMILKAAADEGAYSYDACSHAENGSVLTKALTSGELRSRYNMFRYGRYEARVKAPSPSPTDLTVNGNYIVSLSVFRTPRFEEWRELNLQLVGNQINTVSTDLRYADGQFGWSAGITDNFATDVSGIDARTAFHNYAMTWLPDSVTWYVDGKVIRTYTSPAKLPIPELSAKILMNFWVFGPTAGFGGSEIENNTYPMQAEHEWFRFYKWNGDDSYPCDDLGTSCLQPTDLNLSSNNPCDGIDASGTITGTSKDACVVICE